MDVFDLVARISLDTSTYENALDDASNKTNSFTDTMADAGAALTSTGTAMTQHISMPLLQVGKNMLQTAMDYEAGMSEVQAISGATGTEIELLGDKAKEMASKTLFSTAESAEAYKYMAMAGWETSDMLNALDAVMYLAGASGESLAATSDIVTDAMTAFGLSADGTSKVLKDGYMVEVSNAQRFTDVLAAASNNANTDVSMMGESFKYVAPIAGAMGYSVEDTAVALGLMANNGIKASMSGTALRSIITRLSAPTDDMVVAMEQLGISLQDSEGNMFSLGEVIGQLRTAFNGGQIDVNEFQEYVDTLNRQLESGTITEEEYAQGLDDISMQLFGLEGAQNAAYAKTIAGQYAMAGLLAIVSASDEDYDKLTEAIYNSNGATEEMYTVMNDNAQGAVTMLNSAINVLFTSMGEFLIPAFTDVVRVITDVVNWFNGLDDGTKKLILTIGEILIVVGPALTIAGKIITAISSIATGITKIISIGKLLVSGIQGLFSLIMAHPVIAIIAAIVAAVIWLWNNCEEFRNAIKAILEAIAGFFKAAWEFIKAAWDVAVSFFSGIWEGIKAVFSVVAEVLSGFFTAAWNAIKAVWDAVVGFFSGIWEGIQAVFSVVAEVLGGFFSAAWDAIKAVWDAVVGFFSDIWEGIKAVFSVVADVLGGFFSSAWSTITAVWDAAVGFFSGIWEGIKDVLSAVTDVLGGFFSGAWDVVQGAWGAAVGFFSGVWEGIKNVFGGVADWFKNIFSKAWQAVKDVFSAGGKVFDGIKEGILNSLKSVINAIIGGINKVIAIPFNGINAALDKVRGISILGFKPFSWVGSIAVPQIPLLANGAVIGPNNPFLAILGDQQRGTNIETPESLLRDIYREENGSIVVVLTEILKVLRGNGTGKMPGGDTYNFYSPEALDPVSAAREMRKAKQQMALSYL